MGVKDSLLRDAKTFLFDTNTFAEQVVYYPHTDYGQTPTSRTINAMVVRNQIVAYDADGGQSVVPSFDVYVANDSVAGISTTEVNTGGDQISFPVREGKSAEKRTVVHLVEQDLGVIMLTCN
jgi:hypothetical protein